MSYSIHKLDYSKLFVLGVFANPGVDLKTSRKRRKVKFNKIRKIEADNARQKKSLLK